MKIFSPAKTVLLISILAFGSVWAKPPDVIKMQTEDVRPVAGDLDRFIGNWTGKKNITSEQGKFAPAYVEHLKIEPALRGKFLQIQTIGNNEKIIERHGLISYDPSSGKYALYLFDSTGYAEKLAGEDNDNVIALTNSDTPDKNLSVQFYIEKDNDRFRIFMKGDASSLVYFTKDLPPSRGGGSIPFLPGAIPGPGGMPGQNPGQPPY